MYFPIGWSKSFKVRLKNRLEKKINNFNSNLSKSSEENVQVNGNLCKNEINDYDEFLTLIKTNTDKSFLFILTNISLRVWICKPSVEIVCHVRNNNSLKELGINLYATWKPDSSMIIVQTSKDFLLFYKIIFDCDNYDLFVQNITGGIKKEQFENFTNERIPNLFLELSFYTKINTGISCIMAAEEKAIVCTKQGEIIGVDWNSLIDENFYWNIKDKYFTISNPNLNKSDEFSSDLLFYVINIEYSSDIGGFSLVFANGKAAFMPLKNNNEEFSEEKNEKKYILGKLQFVNDVNNAVVTSINHKYQMLAFGLKNSEAILCCLDELTNNILITHHLSLSPSSFPNANNIIGSLCCLQWSPDSCVLAASWEKGGFIIWSVFGALLSCSLNWDYGTTSIKNKYKQNIYRSLSWAKEGYQLWMIEKNLIDNYSNNLNSNNDDEYYNEQNYRKNVTQISFAKSILTSNPSCISNCGEFVLLVSEDRLYLGIETTTIQNKSIDHETSLNNNFNSTSTQTFNEYLHDSSNEIGNHQWLVISMPPSYCNLNSPIRYASIDKAGQNIAIAGKNGFAIYSMLNKKWKLFGNETQERDFEVCGGLLWYNDYIVMGSYNLVEFCFELRVYPQREKLDNQNAKIIKVPCDILLMSIHKNRLLVFFIDGYFYLYAFYDLKKNHEQISSSASTKLVSSSSSSSSFNSKFVNLSKKDNLVKSSSSIHLILMNQIIVSNIIISPECVTSIILSSLNFENCSNQSNDKLFNDLILMNICGRLFLLELDYNEMTKINKDHQKDGLVNNLVRSQISNSLIMENENLSFNSKIILVYKVVSILASGVENVWVNNLDDNEKRPHLSNALWLACGMNGMGVSLPLLSSVNEKKFSQYKSFISKRIMLPINTHIYPLAILFKDALVIGAENDTILCGKSQFLNKPFSIVSKTSQVYLHHILRELLRRNLGIHALEIANSCTALPYFAHSLELLLHGVLEEEATSSQAIPDPLLPRVIEFIREFPVFLQIVVHCARKTELALWPHLFSVVGNPKDLFEQCLENNNLSTAASYIIVLHNLEKTSVSKQYAKTLLKKVSDKGEIDLLKDLLRFLNAIKPCETVTASTPCLTKK